MRNIEELITLLTKKSLQYPELVLPSFQREFVWTVEAQKSLIASVLSGVPCTSSLIVETKSNIAEFQCREIGANSEQDYLNIPPNVQIKYLLDGQQRYSTLFHVFHNIYHLEAPKLSENREILESIFEKLGYRWFLSFDDAKEFLGFNRLNFDAELFDDYLPEDILDLQVIQEKKLSVNGTEGFSINSELADIKSWCITQRSIPLFLFFDSNHSYIITDLLTTFQNNRIEEFLIRGEFQKLRAIYSDIAFDKKMMVLENPSSKKKEKDSARDEIRQVLVRECERWSKQVFTYLSKKIGAYGLNPIVLTNVSKAVSTYTFINTGGTKLTGFDLICSRASLDLRRTIQQGLCENFNFYDSSFKKKKVKFPDNNFGMFDPKKGWDTSFAMFVIHVFNLVHFKKSGNKIESLPTNFSKFDYSLKNLKSKFIADNIEEVIDVVRKTAYVLYVHCGHSKFVKTTNKLALLPIAAAFIWSKKHDERLIRKIRSFYWIKLFSGYYDKHQNEQSLKDTIEIVSWLAYRKVKVKDGLLQILDGEVMNTKGFSDIEITIRESKLTSNSSLKNNLMFYLRSISGSFNDFDFPNSKLSVDQTHEIHHIIPLANASTIGQGTKVIRGQSHMLNALMNLTPISKKANSEIGRFDLNQYSSRLMTLTLDNHHLTTNWKSFRFDLNNQSSISEYKSLLETRHAEISKDMRTRLRSDLG